MNTKSRHNDISGQKYNRLTVVKLLYIDKNRQTHWECLCDCGKLHNVTKSGLTSNQTKSCGCLKHELDLVRIKTHGYTSNGKVSPTYKSWQAMKVRCTNKNNKGYLAYGAIGIKVCDRWLNSFQNFLEDMGERPNGTSLDRYPNQKGNYEPINCRWATIKQQGENTSKCRVFSHNGITMNISDWSKYFNVHRTTMLKHLRKGKSIVEIFEFYKAKQLLTT